MKTVQELIAQLAVVKVLGDTGKPVSGISSDSRKVSAGMLFLAIKGLQHDGHQYIPALCEQGVSAIVCEVLPEQPHPDVCFVQVANVSAIAGILASAFYNHPSHSMKVVGVTGTNGKTTCATLMHQLFQGLGYKCGLLSTVENRIGQNVIPSTHTTPDPVQLQGLLAQMKDAGCTHAFMEVSSHAIHQERIAGIQFAGALFTNITHDHLDYHKTFDEYIRVKKLFFDGLGKEAFALTNVDDKRGLVMLQNTKARCKTYSLRTMADFKGKVLENSLQGLVMRINEHEVYLNMLGEFNAYNLLAVYGAAIELGETPMEVLQVLSTLPGAEGRFERIVSEQEGILGIVDYAHTPDALLNVLATIQKLRQGNGQIFTVIGCGGDRDAAKRPLMAHVATEHSSRAIFTSDNPRSEDPQTILNDMVAGVPVHQTKKFVCIPDRREAIKTACALAEQGDIILVAGKGHEKYQEIKGVKNPFDDKQCLTDMFHLLEK
ncbi:MAG: UDP-N-acetylmuramoyl-L-alanyl-D-glutamate--2,6-diaminopimelate ligase [Chitinophagaceae bacterium]